MTKADIIRIVKSMDVNRDYRRYYKFAHTYLLHMRARGITDPEHFWAVIRHCRNKCCSLNGSERVDKNTRSAMGITGKADPEQISRWCDYLLEHPALRSADAEALCTIFGYCEHLGK